MVLQQEQALKHTRITNTLKLGGKVEPSAARRGNIWIYLFLFQFFFFFEVMWSFAAAPGRLPLLKETPLSGYLPGIPVPAEWSWMEPRWSAVPHANRTELCVPLLSHVPRAQATPLGAHRDHTKLLPTPVPVLH